MSKQTITDNRSYANTGNIFPWPPDCLQRISYLQLGVLLFSLFVLQYSLNIKLAFLVQWQQLELYKQLSGYFLLFFIVSQWRLGISRMKDRKIFLSKRYHQHKWFGALAPLILYIHAINLGYGYQLLLSIVYLANFSIGIFNCESLKIKHKSLRTTWLTVHIGFAVLTVALVLFHIYVIYWYS